MRWLTLVSNLEVTMDDLFVKPGEIWSYYKIYHSNITSTTVINKCIECMCVCKIDTYHRYMYSM